MQLQRNAGVFYFSLHTLHEAKAVNAKQSELHEQKTKNSLPALSPLRALQCWHLELHKQANSSNSEPALGKYPSARALLQILNTSHTMVLIDIRSRKSRSPLHPFLSPITRKAFTSRFRHDCQRLPQDGIENSKSSRDCEQKFRD